MENRTSSLSCAVTCWLVAAVAGILVLAMFMLLGGWAFLPSAFLAIIAAGVLGLVLSLFVCSESKAKADLNNAEARRAEANQAGRFGHGAFGTGGAGAAGGSGSAHNTAGAAAAGGVAAGAAGAAAAAASSGGASGSANAAGASGGASGSANMASGAASAQAQSANAAAATSDAGASTTASGFVSQVPDGADKGGFEMKASTPLKGEAELADRKGSWKYEAPEKAEAAPKAAAKPAADAGAGAGAASDAAKPAKARAPVAADGQPELMTAPRASGADDLKLISGVGPKLEGTLNELGFWHFDQIANWRKKEIEWVDSRLKSSKAT